MKATETPEKIYINSNLEDRTWLIGKGDTSFIEYTRTDAFIMNNEKALSWLKNHYKDYMYNPTGKRLEAFFGDDMCNDFENYMKGE